MLGDVIVEIDQKPIRSLEQYRSFMIQSPKHLIRLMRTRMGKETFTIIELDLT
jgi:C-terminal processing protease CtpA/Prc